MSGLKQGQVSKKYKDALRPELNKYSKMEVIRVTKDYHLLQDGTIFEETDVTFKYNGANALYVFPWHVPIINADSKVMGVRVKPNVVVTGFRLFKEEKLFLIQIDLDAIEDGEYVHLQFEYFNRGAASIEKRFLKNEIIFPIAFVPADTVSSLDIRLHIPSNAVYEADINLTEFIPVANGSETLLLTSQQESNPIGEISGCVSLIYKTKLYDAFVSVSAGIIFSAILLVLPDFKPSLGLFWYPLVCLMTFSGLFLIYKAVKHN